MIISLDDTGATRKTSMGEMEVLDVGLNVYSSGKFFIKYLLDGLLERLVEDMHDNIKKKYDNMAIVVGAEGSGKSSISFNTCKMYDPNFSIRDCYCADYAALKEHIGESDAPGRTFWLDEAVNIANKRRWQSADNTEFAELLTMMRSRGWTMLMCIPRKEDLDFYIRDHRFRYVITVEPNTFPKYGYKNRGYFSLERVNPDTKKLEFIGYGLYDPIPEDAAEEYDRVKNDAQNKKIQDILEEKGGSKYKKKYEDERRRLRSAVLAMHNSGVDREHIKQLFDIKSDETYYKTIKRAKDDIGATR